MKAKTDEKPKVNKLTMILNTIFGTIFGLFSIFLILALISGIVQEGISGVDIYLIIAIIISIGFTLNFLIYHKKEIFYVIGGLILVIIIIIAISAIVNSPKVKYQSLTQVNSYTKDYLIYENYDVNGYLVISDYNYSGEYDEFNDLENTLLKFNPYLNNLNSHSIPYVIFSDSNMQNNRLFNKMYTEFRIVSDSNLEKYNNQRVAIVGDIKQIKVNCNANKSRNQDYNIELNDLCKELNTNISNYKKSFMGKTYKLSKIDPLVVNYIIVKDIQVINN